MVHTPTTCIGTNIRAFLRPRLLEVLWSSSVLALTTVSARVWLAVEAWHRAIHRPIVPLGAALTDQRGDPRDDKKGALSSPVLEHSVTIELTGGRLRQPDRVCVLLF